MVMVVNSEIEKRCERFIQGLDPQLQIKCQEHGPANLDQAIIIARRIESAG